MMKLCVAILLTAVVAASAFEKLTLNQIRGSRVPLPASEGVLPATAVVNSITQHVDNFNPQNHDTYQQKFYQNGEFFQPGGPLYVFIGGEWNIEALRLEDSLMRELARENEGYTFYLEHRYYGESFPTPNVTTENLRFLSPEQALADLAHFIEHIKRPDVHPGAENSPVIVAGVHYSGTLAAWFRQLYPHLANAAWASGAPTLSVLNFLEYKEVAGAVYRRAGGNECYDRLDRGFAEMEAMAANGQLAELGELFHLCNPLVGQNDINNFFYVISEFYSILVQLSDYVPIDEVCALITSSEQATDAEGVAKIVADLLDEADQCLPLSYDGFILADSETDLDAPSVVYGIRQITYQTCVQFGWHHTSDGEHHPFGSSFPMAHFNQICTDIFGDVAALAQSNSNRVNHLYGGLNPRVTHVLFTHGMNDPWRTVGIQESLGPLAPALLISGHAQGGELGPILETDSPQLIEAKLWIKATLNEWAQSFQGIIPGNTNA